MPHSITKLTKCMIRTFFRWKSGYRTKITFLQLWDPLQQQTNLKVTYSVILMAHKYFGPDFYFHIFLEP